MKKIMFNDKFQLTQAVLEGRKTQTRRIITPQPTYQDNCGICWKGYAYGLSLSNELLGCYINFVSVVIRFQICIFDILNTAQFV